MYKRYFGWKIIMYMLLFMSFSVSVASPTVAETSSCVFDSLVVTAPRGNLYRIDDSSSKVTFGVDTSISRVEGQFNKFSGGILLSKDGQGVGYSAIVIYTETLDTSSTMVKTLLKGEEFFDVDQHPEIVFVNDSFKWIDNNTATISGRLIIRGITRQVTFDVILEDVTNERIQLVASTKINRADYNMDAISSVVDDEVDLILSVEAEKYR